MTVFYIYIYIYFFFNYFFCLKLFHLQRHPAVTPPSYPQVQAPIINNPALWDRLGLETYGTDTLFFAFYYQPVLLLSFYVMLYFFDIQSNHVLNCRTPINNIWLLEN